MVETKKSEQSTKSKESKKTVSKVTKEKRDGLNQESNQTSTKATIKRKEVKPVDNEEVVITAHEASGKQLAKAGKRSAKAIKEAEEKQAKEERKAASEAQREEVKVPKPEHRARTAEDRLKSRGKKYQEAYKKIDHSKSYGIKESLELAAETSVVKFDATVELHVRLGVDPKQADQNIRGTVVLPAGSGKTVRVAVFAEADDVAAAKSAGADIAAGEEFLQQLDKGQFDFDVLISTPSMMSRLGKYARTLGPKGLMPNPKSGTVTKDVDKAVKEAKGGRVEYRVDSAGIVHVGIGKVSFGADKLFENAKAVLSNVKTAKPASIKGNYVLSAYASTAMGPSVQIDLSDVNNL